MEGPPRVDDRCIHADVRAAQQPHGCEQRVELLGVLQWRGQEEIAYFRMASFVTLLLAPLRNATKYKPGLRVDSDSAMLCSPFVR